MGSGRMASAFASAMRDADLSFVSLRGRAKRWSIDERRGRARTILLAVTDAAIRETCERLVREGEVLRGDTVLHCAGMRGVDELSSARGVGAYVGAMHPLVAVASTKRPPSLRGLCASLEGDARALASARAIASPIGLTVIRLEGVDRASYHGAAALCATGGVALAQAASALFVRAARGVTARQAALFAASLLASVAHNVRCEGAEDALASPLLRGDTASVERHLRAMSAYPTALALYLAALSRVIETLMEQRAVEPAVLQRARALVEAPARRR